MKEGGGGGEGIFLSSPPPPRLLAPFFARSLLGNSTETLATQAIYLINNKRFIFNNRGTMNMLLSANDQPFYKRC